MQTTLQFYKYINFLTGLPKTNSIALILQNVQTDFFQSLLDLNYLLIHTVTFIYCLHCMDVCFCLFLHKYFMYFNLFTTFAHVLQSQMIISSYHYH